jgi:probable HAF family extracellular repeat protein
MPQAVSSDGLVVVGSDSSTRRAFRWTNTEGFVELGDLPGGDDRSAAWGVSADGAVIVGSSEVSDDFTQQAFKWTATDGMVGLGSLPGGTAWSIARAVSADGSVIVGGIGPEAFRWTAADGMVGLGDLPGGNFDSEARAVSADGSVIVGTGHTSNAPAGNATSEAFVWTASDGIQSLRDVLIAQGATGLDELLLLDAMGVSADGTAIVGRARYATGGDSLAYMARIAVVPVPAAAWFIAPAFSLLAPWVRRRKTIY